MTAERYDFIPFALPDIGEAEIKAVSEAMRSGWLSSGPAMQRFEHEFAELIGGDVHAVAVNSATAGLHLALEGVGISAGDEVLVPTWTFTATAEVVRYLGAEPVLVDVDPKTLNIDYDAAAQKVNERTKAVMPVHFAGWPIDPTVTADFARKHNLAVVEDAAHALPAGVDGAMVGSGHSDATVFSFYATKTITTGEGGMVVTRSERLASRIKTMRLHGISRDAFDRYRSNVPSWRYDVVAPGYKYNLTDPAAALGSVQLARAEEMRGRREAIARRYLEGLSDVEIELPQSPTADRLHSWHLFVVRMRDGHDRDKFVDAMSRAGVGTSVHFIPLHMHPYWRDHGGYRDADFPIATKEFGRVTSLPIFSSMSDTQVDRVIAGVREATR